MSSLRRWGLLGLTAAAAALPACIEFGEISRDPLRPPTGCSGIESCPQGLICEAGACVGGEPPERALVIRVRPPRSTGLGAVETRTLFTDRPILALAEVALPQTIDLEAELLYQGEPIPARAVARPQGVVDPAAFEVSADPVVQADGPRTRLPLVPWWPREPQFAPGEQLGIRYDIQFVPQLSPPDDLPPWTVLDESVNGLADDAALRSFSLPGPEGLVTLDGRLTLSPEQPTPLQGVPIFAQDAAGRRVSTEAETDEEGRFSLRFWRPTRETEYTLRVRPARPDRPLPELQVPVRVLLEGELEFLDVFLGNVGTLVNFTGRLDGSFGDVEEPVVGASLRFVGQVSGGRYETWALSGMDGAFNVQLFPGTYQVGLDPPLSGDFRHTRTRLDVEPMAPGDPTDALSFTVRPRSRVFGQLMAPDGSPLAEGRVVATLVEAASGDPSLQTTDFAPPIRTVSALADDAGRFELFLDPGTHSLAIEPPLGRGLPSFVTTTQVPVEQTTGLDLRTLSVPPAASLSIELVDQEMAPVENAVVEVWWEDESGRIDAGQGSSDASGQVFLSLPNPSGMP
ncbi:MAG: hypothetical protein ACE366_05555 [Bradymonadia bacterium]